VDRYLVLKCPKCRKVIAADGLHKKRTCPLCSHEIDLRKARILFAHSSPRAAALAAQQAMERSSRSKNPDRDFKF
jgi:hypothetical protein